MWRPREVLIEITYECPLKCKHCSSYNNFSSPEDKLTGMEIDKIIDDLIELGVELVEISGGEPLCHPHVYNMIRYAKEKELKVYLYTSGVIKHSESIGPINGSIAEKLNDLRVDKICVNMQGADPRVHDSITGVVGSFNYLRNSVRSLLENNLYVAAHFVPMKPNLKQFESVIDYASKIGIREVGVLRFVAQGRGRVNKKSLALSRSQTAQFMEVLNTQRKRTDVKVRLGVPIDFCFLLEESQDPIACTAGINKCAIMANGTVIPCPAYKELPDYVAGNIRCSSLKELWNESKVFERFRDFNYSKLKGLCSKCPYVYSCKGRCPAQRILDGGDLYQGPNGYCLRTRHYKGNISKVR